MEQAQKDIQDIQFHFNETTRRASFDPTVVSGMLSFQKPYRLRVNQDKPEKQMLVTDGTILSIYTPGAGQEMTGSWKAWVAQTHFPVLLLSFVGDFPVSAWPERYTILFGGYDQHLYKILFKPKSPADAPLDLWVSDQTFFPVRGHLEADSASVEITFKDVKMNPGLTDAFFKLRIPEGTPVIPLSL